MSLKSWYMELGCECWRLGDASARVADAVLWFVQERHVVVVGGENVEERVRSVAESDGATVPVWERCSAGGPKSKATSKASAKRLDHLSRARAEKAKAAPAGAVRGGGGDEDVAGADGAEAAAVEDAAPPVDAGAGRRTRGAVAKAGGVLTSDCVMRSTAAGAVSVAGGDVGESEQGARAEGNRGGSGSVQERGSGEGACACARPR